MQWRSDTLAHQQIPSRSRSAAYALAAETLRPLKAPTALRCDRARPPDADRATYRSSAYRRDRSRATPAHIAFRADACATDHETSGRSAPQTLAWAIQNAPADMWFKGCLKDIFTLATTQLQTRREPCRPLDQGMVKQRDAHLERVCHTGTIYFGLDIPWEISLEVGILHLRQWIVSQFGTGSYATSGLQRHYNP
jgi:hypothetical protein